MWSAGNAPAVRSPAPTRQARPARRNSILSWDMGRLRHGVKTETAASLRPTLSYDISAARATQPAQSHGKDGGGPARAFPELVEAGEAVQGVAQDHQAPGVADPLHRAGHRTKAAVMVRISHPARHEAVTCILQVCPQLGRTRRL